MRTINRRVICIYLLIITYIIIRVLSVSNSSLMISNEVNTGIWGGFFVLCYLLTRKDYNRYLEQYDKVQTTFIVIITYLMIYFLIGLFVGYQYNAYSMTLKGILNNTLIFMPIIVFQEYIRQVLVSYSGGKNKYFVVITILFILISVNFNSFVNDFRTSEAGFKFVCSDLIPLVCRNVVFTYLAYISSSKPAIVYRVLTTASTIYLPILPNVSWFYTGLFGIIVPMILYILVNYSHAKVSRKVSWRETQSSRPITYLPILVVVIIMVCFVVGVFKYQPVAVVSDSMLPVFARGDAIVIEKVSEKQIDNLKVGDIIKFEADNYHVIHRIYAVDETEDGKVFTTKGDNNNAPDSKKVIPEQVQGIYKMKVKYAGFPSVWLSEVLR